MVKRFFFLFPAPYKHKNLLKYRSAGNTALFTYASLLATIDFDLTLSVLEEISKGKNLLDALTAEVKQSKTRPNFELISYIDTTLCRYSLTYLLGISEASEFLRSKARYAFSGAIESLRAVTLSLVGLRKDRPKPWYDLVRAGVRLDTIKSAIVNDIKASIEAIKVLEDLEKNENLSSYLRDLYKDFKKQHGLSIPAPSLLSLLYRFDDRVREIINKDLLEEVDEKELKKTLLEALNNPISHIRFILNIAEESPEELADKITRLYYDLKELIGKNIKEIRSKESKILTLTYILGGARNLSDVKTNKDGKTFYVGLILTSINNPKVFLYTRAASGESIRILAFPSSKRRVKNVGLTIPAEISSVFLVDFDDNSFYGGNVPFYVSGIPIMNSLEIYYTLSLDPSVFNEDLKEYIEAAVVERLVKYHKKFGMPEVVRDVNCKVGAVVITRGGDIDEVQARDKLLEVLEDINEGNIKEELKKDLYGKTFIAPYPFKDLCNDSKLELSAKVINIPKVSADERDNVFTRFLIPIIFLRGYLRSRRGAYEASEEEILEVIGVMGDRENIIEILDVKPSEGLKKFAKGFSELIKAIVTRVPGIFRRI